MKLARLSAILVVLLALAAGAAWRFFPIQVYALVDRIAHPIGKTRPIAWAKGPASPPPGQRPPNIVLIVADDLGINDLTSTGSGVANGAVPTPNIDSIASDGAMFETGYAANATCSPSRAALMTGRYPIRYGFEFTSVPTQFAKSVAAPEPGHLHQPIFHSEFADSMPPLADQGLPSEQITLAETLKTRGYHTIHIGKWHLGESPKLRPEAQGFDESLGFMAGASKYLGDDDPDGVGARLPYDPVDRFLWIAGRDGVQFNGSARFHPSEYMTDYFTKQAVAAIDANRNRPFFMYLAYNAPHTPLQARREDYAALSGIKDHKARVYGAMIRALDRGVGQVLAALKSRHIDGETLVIFTSDNGGAWYVGLPDINKPYRGWKATFFEGGIRVPFFMRWPGTIAPGQRLTTPAGHLDVFATTASAAGAKMPADRHMDSLDLLPMLNAKTPIPADRTLFWRSGGLRVVRAGSWKLQVARSPAKAWLFDLATDPTEHRNLAPVQPERVRQLTAMLDAHDAQMPRQPLWHALVEGPIRIDVPLNAPWRADQEYAYWSN